MIPDSARGQSAGRKKLRSIFVAAVCAAVVAGMEESAAGGALLENVRVTVPASVVFQATNLSVPTVAASGNEAVRFNQSNLDPGRALRISVKAEGDSTPAALGPILASSFSWTTSGVTSGIGFNGVLSKLTYTPVYESNVGAKTGKVDLTWTMAPQGPSIRAGTHQITLRWKFEAVTP